MSRDGAFVPSTVPDLNIGSMRSQGVEFKSSENGRDIRGFTYVTVENDEAIIVTIEDVLSHADVTLPLLQESLKTIVLDGITR
jgi:hypothetical protein